MTDWKTGLVSITFRSLPPDEIIQLVTRAGQQGIEWGGDVHVPHGDVTVAETVGRMTRDAGLEVAAYGSYYRLADEREQNPDFATVLASAVALGAPVIRVWAGTRGSADADEAYRAAVRHDARRISLMAAEQNVRIALEYHGGTLTDSIASSVELLKGLPLDNLDTLWQPPNGRSVTHCLESLERVLKRVSNVHVFHWGDGGWSDRMPLSEGTEHWLQYLDLLARIERPRWLLQEFVLGDDPEQYLRDAETLNGWLAGR